MYDVLLLFTTGLTGLHLSGRLICTPRALFSYGKIMFLVLEKKYTYPQCAIPTVFDTPVFSLADVHSRSFHELYLALFYFDITPLAHPRPLPRLP